MNPPTPFASTPEPPYYAVIFTSLRADAADSGYDQTARRMLELASAQPGFLGVESVRGENGFGITVSYWSSEEAIAQWKAHLEHKAAQEAGKRVWYADYHLRVAKVDRAYTKSKRFIEPDSSRTYEIRLDDLRGPEIAALLSEHLRALAKLSPPESMHALDLEALRAPDITFWSVWCGPDLAGCGALKELDSRHGEIKSMRTAQEYLGKGVATFLLQHILAEAGRRGYQRLSLETGSMPAFQPAHNLYRKFGFSPCPPFGDYIEDPNSLFMTLLL